MTTTGAELPVAGDPPPAGASAVHPWSWHASRAAALLLVVLIPLHFAVTFLVDDIGSTTARSFSARLEDPTWRLLTWLTIALAMVHATLGAGSGLRRRVPGRGGVALAVVVAVVAGAVLVAASWVLATRHV